MRLQKEPIVAVHPLLDKLLHDYFRRTMAKVGVPPLRMNWPAYVTLEQHKNLLVVTAREPVNKLVGFVMYHIYPHLHHMDYICAACDILAVDVDMRGKGIARAMLEYAEPMLRDRGVRIITHMFRTIYDTEPLFTKIGYTLAEQGYMKELG